MARAPIWLFLCPSCETGYAFGESLHSFECTKCLHHTRHPGVELFGADEWEAENRLEYLAGCLTALDVIVSARQKRLLLTVAARTVCAFADGQFRQAVETAERWADAEEQPDTRELVRQLLEGLRNAKHRSAEWEWRALALACLERNPSVSSGPFRVAPDSVFAAAYRELLPNPFLPLAWNADWLTSTAVALAHTTYESRDFSVMPILADALQDAGCEDERILGHCRGPGPHARGCWVLDAILGKS